MGTLDQYQASRTFVISVSLSGVRHQVHPRIARRIYHVLRYQAANSQKVTEYLNSTYDEYGHDMSFKLPRPECRGTILDIKLDGGEYQRAECALD